MSVEIMVRTYTRHLVGSRAGQTEIAIEATLDDGREFNMYTTLATSSDPAQILAVTQKALVDLAQAIVDIPVKMPDDPPRLKKHTL